jgi:hypothetical protein
MLLPRSPTPRTHCWATTAPHHPDTHVHQKMTRFDPNLNFRVHNTGADHAPHTTAATQDAQQHTTTIYILSPSKSGAGGGGVGGRDARLQEGWCH